MTMNDSDPNTPSDPLELHRRQIDRIDKTIVALLNERIRTGLRLGALKRAQARPARSGAREAEVLANVRCAAVGPLAPDSAERIFAAIIAETVAAQEADHD